MWQQDITWVSFHSRAVVQLINLNLVLFYSWLIVFERKGNMKAIRHILKNTTYIYSIFISDLDVFNFWRKNINCEDFVPGTWCLNSLIHPTNAPVLGDSDPPQSRPFAVSQSSGLRWWPSALSWPGPCVQSQSSARWHWRMCYWTWTNLSATHSLFQGFWRCLIIIDAYE